MSERWRQARPEDASGSRALADMGMRRNRQDLPPEVRDFLVDRLAGILVEDYQQHQRVKEATVKEGSLFNRGLSLAACSTG
ncbi:MAG: hypothetical protein ACRDGM_03670 [bacterium]